MNKTEQAQFDAAMALVTKLHKIIEKSDDKKKSKLRELPGFVVSSEFNAETGIGTLKVNFGEMDDNGTSVHPKTGNITNWLAPSKRGRDHWINFGDSTKFILCKFGTYIKK